VAKRRRVSWWRYNGGQIVQNERDRGKQLFLVFSERKKSQQKSKKDEHAFEMIGSAEDRRLEAELFEKSLSGVEHAAGSPGGASADVAQLAGHAGRSAGQAG
jgi:UDP-N-acetylenolpyruvoylglucosamine reductase